MISGIDMCRSKQISNADATLPRPSSDQRSPSQPMTSAVTSSRLISFSSSWRASA
jgi:hypothetical protein